mmetsp:Transcript_10614/g.24708  ORF Transcript_10614/g.24708 Transcript_10614/m.24708 type:complete len:248 (+) Transcript_10614:4194-4937(+)
MRWAATSATSTRTTRSTATRPGTGPWSMIAVYPVGIPLLYSALLWAHRGTLVDPAAMIRERENSSPTIGHLNFLIDAYKPDHFYFEVFECVRRLLLASIVGIASADSAAAPVAGTVCCVFFNYAFTRLRPFKLSEDSSLGIVLQLSLTLFFLSALIIKVDASPDQGEDQRLFGVFLFGVFLAGPTMVLGQLVLSCVAAGLLRRPKAEAKGGNETPEAETAMGSGQEDATPAPDLSGEALQGPRGLAI